jgi:hypothetical protein
MIEKSDRYDPKMRLAATRKRPIKSEVPGLPGDFSRERGVDMNAQTLWNGRRGLLMASATPGSAVAYQAGDAAAEAGVVQRNMATTAAAGRAHPGDGFALMSLVSERIAQFFDELDALAWSRQQQSREAWLAGAQNLAELESRVRQLDGSLGLPGRALW